jgi:hypothetical protein
MLDELIEETIAILEGSFYKDKFHFSYSSISKLLYSPNVFYQLYILGHRDRKTEKHLVEGSIIHCLLLEPESFDKDYMVSPATLPTGKSKQLVDLVYYKSKSMLELNPDLEFSDLDDNILLSLTEIGYYQNIKSDIDRLAKVCTSETKNYFEFLKKKGNKELVDEETVRYCQSAVDVIQNNTPIMNLIGRRMNKTGLHVHDEIALQCELDGKTYGLRGILDNLVIDNVAKKITINDFKTSSKDLKDFINTIEFYGYWMQAAIYLIMVGKQYIDLLEQGYELEFNFVVIDKYFNVYAFPVSPITQHLWMQRFQEVLTIVDYHYDNNRYELPYEFDMGNVIL